MLKTSNLTLQQTIDEANQIILDSDASLGHIRDAADRRKGIDLQCIWASRKALLTSREPMRRADDLVGSRALPLQCNRPR